MDTVFFLSILALGATLLALTTMLPALRRAERLERRAAAVEAQVEDIAARIVRLRREVEALQSDPWFIERNLRLKMRKLRPDLFEQADAPRLTSGDGGRSAPSR